MPTPTSTTTGRAPVSTGARQPSQSHTRKSSQSAADHHQHRREKTKSSPSYVQGRPHNQPATQTAGADPAPHAQRPSKSRAHSAPHIPKSSSSSRNPVAAHQDQQDGRLGSEGSDNDDAGLFDDEPSDDEAIADDPFFQRFDMPSQTTQTMSDRRGTFLSHDEVSDEEEEDDEGPLSPTSTVPRARPDSTAEPLQSPLNPNSPSTV
jgi:hypothetical protein